MPAGAAVSSTAIAATGIRRRPVTDYATARLTHHRAGRVRRRRQRHAAGAAVAAPIRRRPAQRPRKQFVFDTAQPARYLAVLISRFRSSTRALTLPASDSRTSRRVRTSTRRSPIEPSTCRRGQSARSSAGRAVSPTGRRDILTFYASLLGDAPYDSFTLAITESDLPGGHSPAYFAIAQPAAAARRRSCGATIRWRSRTIRRSSSRTKSRISGGGRRSAGRTTTSSG